MKKRFLVLGGTSYDTEIGVNLMNNKGLIAFGCPLSDNPTDQTNLQANSVEELELEITNKIQYFANDFDEIVIFCNSLSFSMDWKRIQSRIAYPINSLVDSYNDLIFNTKSIGLLTGNIHTLSSVNLFLKKKYWNISIFGLAVLPLITKIEFEKKDPINTLSQFIDLCRSVNIQDVIIGCTHFESVKIMKENNNMNLIFPGQKLIDNLITINK